MHKHVWLASHAALFNTSDFAQAGHEFRREHFSSCHFVISLCLELRISGRARNTSAYPTALFASPKDMPVALQCLRSARLEC
jgi:hypothetical protein